MPCWTNWGFTMPWAEQKHIPFCLVLTGTGTDVGKTVTTAALLASLLDHQDKAMAVKIVQTGIAEGSAGKTAASDSYHYRMAGAGAAFPTAQTLHSYPLAASPHLAARLVGQKLSCQELASEIRTFVSAHSDYDVLLFETAGGLHVPLNEHEDWLTLLPLLGFPVLLCAANCLGSINHTLLSLDALERSACKVLGLVLNQTHLCQDENERSILSDNIASLRQRLPHLPLSTLPYCDSEQRFQKLSQALIPLRELIVRSKTPKQATSLIERDRASLWHPYSSAEASAPLSAVRTAYANRLILEDGRELIDGMSSWWCAVHGYRHPHLERAISRQLAQLPHVMFGGLTHAGAIGLAERLKSHLPKQLNRVFLADSGSVAVEVALKMALQYQYGLGEKQRRRFLAPLGGYHGDTMGAMSVCDPVNGMHQLFSDCLAKQIFMPRPTCRFDQPFDPQSLEPAKSLLAQRGEEIAAVILEPIVQGAGGMWFYHPDYLKGLAELCQQAGTLLIFDEIATGFGHTGKFMALEWAGVTPDILCLGKALTGGSMTLAATLCTDTVAQGICAHGQVFMHGPTFMANPLACACAHASLDLLETGAWQKQVHDIEQVMRSELAVCATLPSVADVRVLGDIGVVQTKSPVDCSALSRYCIANGVWIRPFNNLVYLMPPYISPLEDIATLCRTIFQALLTTGTGI